MININCSYVFKRLIIKENKDSGIVIYSKKPDLYETFQIQTKICKCLSKFSDRLGEKKDNLKNNNFLLVETSLMTDSTSVRRSNNPKAK
jgi:hypothetical protein